MSLPAVLPAAITHVVTAVVRLVDESPQPEDVKAGWTAFAVFLLLAAAVAVLGLSLIKHLRKAEAAKNAGAYGDEPVDPGDAPATGDEFDSPS